jgi:hypothetical protein
MVFVVTINGYVYGVFSSMEKAEQSIKQECGDDEEFRFSFSIEEFEMNQIK